MLYKVGSGSVVGSIWSRHPRHKHNPSAHAPSPHVPSNPPYLKECLLPYQCFLDRLESLAGSRRTLKRKVRHRSAAQTDQPPPLCTYLLRLEHGCESGSTRQPKQRPRQLVVGSQLQASRGTTQHTTTADRGRTTQTRKQAYRLHASCPTTYGHHKRWTCGIGVEIHLRHDAGALGVLATATAGPATSTSTSTRLSAALMRGCCSV